MALGVFLTGATGYVGSAILDALLRAGHRVTAIARDPEKVARLEARGASGLLAGMNTPERYMEAVAATDVVIHAAIEHSPRGPQTEAEFLDRVLPALRAAEGPRAFIYTSGIYIVGAAPAPVDESVVPAPAAIAAWRVPHEQRVLEAATSRLRTAVVRPGYLYGGARGVISDLLKDALNGLIRVIGPGTNHWPCIYDRDLADLYVCIAESPQAAGIFHANDEGDEQVNDLVAAIAAHVAQRPDIRHMPIAEARGKMGAYADALVLDQKLRSPRARALGWAPTLHGVSGSVARLFEEYRNAHA